MSPPGGASAAVSRGAPLTVVTGADRRFAGCLAQLLANLARRGVNRAHPVRVYDLGMSVRQRAEIARRYPWADLRDFDLSAWPPHVAPATGTFSWKPIITAQVAEETEAPLLWLDSACLVLADLASVRRAVERDGLFVLRGQTALRAHCDPRVATVLGAEPPLLDHLEYAAGVVGADPRRPAVRALLRQWRAWALDPSLVAAHNPDHRNDQSLFSLLVLRAQASGQIVLHAVDDVDISAPSPTSCLSTRSKVPAWWPGWAEPLSYAYFRVWKTIDQFGHRVRRFKATRIDGLHRWTRERFEVRVGRLGEPASRVRPPQSASYYADPFLCRRDGVTWLLVEEFRYLENAGRLVARRLYGRAGAGEARPLDLRCALPVVNHTPEPTTGSEARPPDPRCALPESAAPGLPMRAAHRSFPFVFESEGRLHLVSESCALKAVDLFVCDVFPHRWRWVRRLLDGVDAADTTLLPHDGRWWLFTSVRAHPDAPRALEIHHVVGLLSDPLIPHPVNADRLYADAPHGTGRCAGTWVRDGDGGWLRPVQASVRRYGEGMRYMRIDTLTPEAFAESPYRGPHPLAALVARVSPHHLATHGDLVAFDVRW